MGDAHESVRDHLDLYIKMDFACGGDHIWGGDAASFSRPFHALRQPVQVTGWRGALFYLWRGVNEYEPEIHLPRLWDTLWATRDCAGNASVSRSEMLRWPGRRSRSRRSRRNLIQNIRRLA